MTTYNTILSPSLPPYSRIEAGARRIPSARATSSSSRSDSSENTELSSSRLSPKTPASIGTRFVMPSSHPSSPMSPNLQKRQPGVVGMRSCGETYPAITNAAPTRLCHVIVADAPRNRSPAIANGIVSDNPIVTTAQPISLVSTAGKERTHRAG